MKTYSPNEMDRRQSPACIFTFALHITTRSHWLQFVGSNAPTAELDFCPRPQLPSSRFRRLCCTQSTRTTHSEPITSVVTAHQTAAESYRCPIHTISSLITTRWNTTSDAETPSIHGARRANHSAIRRKTPAVLLIRTGSVIANARRSLLSVRKYTAQDAEACGGHNR